MEARRQVERDAGRAFLAFGRAVARRRGDWSRWAVRISPTPIARRNEVARRTLDRLDQRHDAVLSARLQSARARLDHAGRLLATLKLSDDAILERGYALVLGPEGTLLRRAADIADGMDLTLRFADGEARAIGGQAESTSSGAAKGGRSKQADRKPPGSQGSLF